MPVTAVSLSKVVRSPSLHSEQSSSLSEPRHVSFNQDVAVKRIPKKVLRSSRSFPLNPADEFSGRCDNFVNVPPPTDRDQIAVEAEEIIKQLEEIECSVSSNPSKAPPPRTRVLSPSPAGRLFSSNPPPHGRVLSPTPAASRQSTLERIKPFLGGRLSKSSSDLLRSTRAMRVEGTSEQEDGPSPADNRLYGGSSADNRLYGASSDDNRLYGLHALSNLDNAVNGKLNNLYRDSSGSTDYSPPPKKNNYTPPKPPRKAPSASPPNIRKGYASLDELEFVPKRNNMYEQENYGAEPTFPNSYTSTNPALNHLRASPSRYSPFSRQSPSRGNHTDSEILSSPSQVLYATISADKSKHSHLKNQHIVHSASQTVQSGFRPVQTLEHPIKSRTSSKENILDDPPYRFANGSGNQASRSLERFVDSDKENRRQELKARIHVTSPNRFTPDRQVARKPYKTTINTANDTIQYRGFSSENLNPRGRDDERNKKNQFLHSGKRVDTEHYKVPKNKAPVPTDLLARRTRRNESEPLAYSASYNSSERPNQFESTSLVRNAESRQKGLGEYDREGRRIHSDRSAERSRAYSGYSTSPDRELSPDRYAKPRGNGKVYPLNRSPSTSPTRPPRRAASSGEIQIPVRREHSGRRVERTPSTRAAATSRSPIKKIQRVNNEIQAVSTESRSQRDELSSRLGREPSDLRREQPRTLTLSRDRGDQSGARGTKTLISTKVENKPNHEDRLSKFTEYRGDGEENSRSIGRRGSHSVGERVQDSNRESDREMYERERGHSVPPGANIDSMRDFYKTSQYRSMYHLPPSPSRPAPILDRANKTLDRTLRRERTGDALVPPPRRTARTSVSEGELTDDTARQERVMRQRNLFINNLASKNGDAVRRPAAGDAVRRPAGGDAVRRPAVGEAVRRTGSGDRELEARKVHRGGEGRRQPGSREREKRPAPQPPTQRVRRSSVEVLETSLSESESPRQDKAKSEVGGRWIAGQSDVDTDYRRDVVGSVHSEARGRDGGRRDGNTPPSIYQQAASLGRREVEISQDDDEEEVVRSPTSLAREEERRKILELEEDRRRKGTSVSRSGSRVSKIIGLKPKVKVPDTTENESQYSGHSSSSVRKEPIIKTNRLNNGARVKRTGSAATSASRVTSPRRKLPGSVTSSINSSESEHGSVPQSAGSRGTNASAQSNRSVYLHATAVADIPSTHPKNGVDPAAVPAPGNLKNSKKISRSISLLAPFKPKQTKDKELNYDSAGNQVPYSGKPPRPPPPARRIQPNMTRDKKFASSSDLLRDEDEIVISPTEEQKSSKVSRSVSMPKDTRLAGWFKKRKRV